MVLGGGVELLRRVVIVIFIVLLTGYHTKFRMDPGVRRSGLRILTLFGRRKNVLEKKPFRIFHNAK